MAQKRRATSSDVAARAGVSRTTVSFVLNGRADGRHPRGHPPARDGRRQRARLPPPRRGEGAGRRRLAHDRARPAPVARAGLGGRAARRDPVGDRLRGAPGRLPRPRRAVVARARPVQRPRPFAARGRPHRLGSPDRRRGARSPWSRTGSRSSSRGRCRRSTRRASTSTTGRAPGPPSSTCWASAIGGSAASPTPRSPTPRPPTGSRATATPSRRPASPTIRPSWSRAPSTRPAAMRPRPTCLTARRMSPRCSSPATSWPSARCEPSARRDAGCPADVSVVGFDDIPLAQHFDPPLTTIRLPARALGAAAGRALVERLAGRAVDRTDAPTHRAHRARVHGRAPLEAKRDPRDRRDASRPPHQGGGRAVTDHTRFGTRMTIGDRDGRARRRGVQQRHHAVCEPGGAASAPAASVPAASQPASSGAASAAPAGT